MPVAQPTIAQIPPAKAQFLVGGGQAVFIDVRERGEYDEVHIPGAVLIPLSAFDADAVLSAAGGKDIIFLCRSGKRADSICGWFTQATGRPAACLEGSMLAWQAAGLPVESA